MGVGFGDVNYIYLLKNKVQCRKFVAEPSGTNA
jgi:hypothetical protein